MGWLKKEVNMGSGERLARAIDWSSFESAGRGGYQVGESLVQLLSAEDAAGAIEAFAKVENVVFSQDDIYPSAEPVIDVLLSSLTTERATHVQVAILDLLFHLVRGHCAEDAGLSTRIRLRAQRGVWLLVHLAKKSPVLADAVDELLDLLDEEVALQALSGGEIAEDS